MSQEMSVVVSNSRSTLPLMGMVFCITCTLSVPRVELEALIVEHGGEVTKFVTKFVTHFVRDYQGHAPNEVKVVTEAWVRYKVGVSSSYSVTTASAGENGSEKFDDSDDDGDDDDDSYKSSYKCSDDDCEEDDEFDGDNEDYDDSDWNKTLYVAAKKGDLDKINEAVANGADIDFIPPKRRRENTYGLDVGDHIFSALSIACFKANMEVIERLLELGANMEDAKRFSKWRDDRNGTPLFVALVARHRNVVDFLLSKGADVQNTHPHYHFCAQHALPYLNIASYLGFADIVEVLLDRGANINQTCGEGLWLGDPMDNSGWTPLVTAIYWRRVDVVKLLLDRGADISKVCSYESFTPLYFGIIGGHKRILKLLLEKIEAELPPNMGNRERNKKLESGLDIFYATRCDSHDAFQQVQYKYFEHNAVKIKEERIGVKKTLKVLLNHTLKRPIDETDQVLKNKLEANVNMKVNIYMLFALFIYRYILCC